MWYKASYYSQSRVSGDIMYIICMIRYINHPDPHPQSWLQLQSRKHFSSPKGLQSSYLDRLLSGSILFLSSYILCRLFINFSAYINCPCAYQS